MSILPRATLEYMERTGKLPPIETEVSLEDESIINLTIALLIVVVVAVVLSRIGR